MNLLYVGLCELDEAEVSLTVSSLCTSILGVTQVRRLGWWLLCLLFREGVRLYPRRTPWCRSCCSHLLMLPI